jgi:hypothetical protein
MLTYADACTGAASAFEVGERHTYTHEGVFVYEPRERFSSGHAYAHVC